MLTLVLLVSVALAFVVTLWAVPRTWLLPIALLVTVLLPVGFLPLPQPVTVVTPGALAVIVWTLRRDARDRRRPARVVLVVGSALSTLLVVGALVGISLARSLAWGGAFTLLVLVPALSPRLRMGEVQRLLDTFTWSAAALAGYGIVERLLGTNPLYGAVLGVPQYWSDYRITTALGHPLHNSIYFAAATAIAIGRYVERGRPSSLVTAALGLIGVFLTISRGGLVAVGVGVLVVAVGPVLRSRQVARAAKGNLRGLLTFAAVGVGLAVIATSPVFQERQNSSNGIASARARDELGPLVWSASRSIHHLGSGPGTSNWLLETLGRPTIIENSWFQLLLSLGLPGTFLVAALVGLAVTTALRGGSLGAAAGLAALVTSAAGFNWIESNRPAMLFLGLLLACALGEGRSTSDLEVAGARSTAALPLTPGDVWSGSALLGSGPTRRGAPHPTALHVAAGQSECAHTEGEGAPTSASAEARTGRRRAAAPPGRTARGPAWSDRLSE